MKINIGIDLNKDFCEVVIDSEKEERVRSQQEVNEVLEDAMLVGILEDEDIVITKDGKTIRVSTCPECGGQVLHLEKRSICQKCGAEKERT